ARSRVTAQLTAAMLTARSRVTAQLTAAMLTARSRVTAQLTARPRVTAQLPAAMLTARSRVTAQLTARPRVTAQLPAAILTARPCVTTRRAADLVRTSLRRSPHATDRRIPAARFDISIRTLDQRARTWVDRWRQRTTWLRSDSIRAARLTSLDLDNLECAT